MTSYPAVPAPVGRASRLALLLVRSTGWLFTCLIAAAAPRLVADSPVIVFQAATAADYTVATELWKTDGTAGGTSLLKEINPGEDPEQDFMNPGGPRSSWPQGFFALGNGRMLFSATDSANGTELWVTDGTLAGTSLVKDIRLGTGSSSPSRFTRLTDEQAVFIADDGTAGAELWITDGTAAGTSLLKDVNAGAQGAFIDELVQLSANKVIFIAYTPAAGRELWVTNGTTAGTVQVGDLNPGANDFYPTGFLVMNGQVLFFAQRPEEGKELWRTDGTLDGTALVKDIRPGASSSIVASWPKFGALGDDRAVFAANDGTDGEELWVTDGTEDGTVLLKDIAASGDSSPNAFVAAGPNHVVFLANDRSAGGLNEELWITNGTEAGTVTKNIHVSSSSRPRHLTYDGIGKVYFSAESSSAVGEELWVTDLTVDGTVMVKDIDADNGDSSSPAHFFSLGDGRMLFSASSGAGASLWITDGTGPGTTEVSSAPRSPAFLTEIIGEISGSGLSLPTFVGPSTTLTVPSNSSATDIKYLFHVRDTDSSQTLTWFQSVAPAHGTLTIINATATSGDTEIIPGGTITYTPTPGYFGDDSFTLHVSDDIATDTRTISVTVSSPPPDHTAPTLSSSSPAHNDTGFPVNLDLTLTFSEPVRAGTGNIILRPTSGGDITIPVGAAQVSFNGTTVTINPTADLAYSMNYHVIIASGVILDIAGNAFAGIALDGLGFTTADTIGPVITSVVPPSNVTYRAGQNLDFVVHFNEAVLVTGMPRISLTVGATSRHATYHSGHNSAALTFRYTTAAPDLDTDGIAMAASISLNGGTLKNGAGDNAGLTFSAPSTSGIKVDAVAPTVVNVTSPTASGVYKGGATILVRVTFSEAVIVDATNGTPRITLETGAVDRNAGYTSGSGTTNLTFTYHVQATDETTDLDYKTTGSLSANGGTIKDAAGNNATLTLPAPGAEGSLSNNKTLVVDNTSPVSYATAGAAYTENFNAGLPSVFNNSVPWKNNTTFPGWYINYDLNNVVPSTYRINFVSDVGSVQHFRTSGTATNGALGGRPNNTTDALMYAVRLVNDTGMTLTEFSLGYKGEQWFNSDEGLNNNLIVSYQFGPQVHLDNGTWTEIPGLQFNSPHDGDGDGPGAAVDLNGHDAANSEVLGPVSVTGLNWAPGTELWIRWFDTNSFNADHALALDDVTFRAFPHGIPVVASVTPPADRIYRTGEELTFTVTFDHPVAVTGEPSLSLNIGGAGRTATFAGCDGPTALTFSYTIQATEMDTDGIAVASPVALNGGTVKDAYDRAAVLTFAAPDTTGVIVDNRPVLVSFTPVNGATTAAPGTDLTLTFNETITAVAGKFIALRRAADDSVLATIEAGDTARVTVVDDIVTIDLPADLLYSTTYYVQVDAGAFVNAAALGYIGIADTTTWRFGTELRAEVTAADSAAFASYFANTSVSTINLVADTTYAFTGGEVARTLTIHGNGATLQAGAGLLRTVVRGGMFGDYINVPVLLEVGSGGALTIDHVTLQNNGNHAADTGILAVINVKNGGTLSVDHVTFKDFHNNVTPGTNRAFGVHAEPGAVSTTVTDSTFGRSNAFRSAIAIRGGEFTLTGNTFVGTAEPDRLPNDDGYEYAVYLYGGTGVVSDNAISGFDRTKQPGYTSSGVAIFGAFDLDVTLEANFFLNSADPEASSSDNGLDIDITRAWKPNTDPTITITVDGTDYILGPSADADAAFKAGEALRAGNDTDKVAVLLDQNDEVLIEDTVPPDFAVLGGYRAPYLSMTDATPVSAKLHLPTSGDDALILAAATALDLEQQKDAETTWTAVTPTWTGVPDEIVLTLEANHLYRFRAKLTHASYVEDSDPTPRTLTTYTNRVTLDTAAPPSVTSALTAGGTYGAPFTYTIAASNSPVSFAATPLPAGLSVDAGTGVISGTPTVTGSFSILLTATNTVGTGPSATLVLTIAKASASVSLAGLSHVYDGAPKAAWATTTPASLPVSFSYDGGAIAPTTAGSYAVLATIDSPNYAGSASGTLVIGAAPQTISFAGPGDAVIGQSVGLSATATSGLPVSFSVISGPATVSGSTLTATGVGPVTVRASQAGSANYTTAPNVDRSFNVTVGAPPNVTTPAQVPAPQAGGTAQLVVVNSSPNVSYQWQRNGSDLPSATGPSLTLDDVQPPTAGLYTYTATVPGGGGTSEPVIVGIDTTEKVIGMGEEVGTDILHPNGNTYDQVLLEGPAATLTANPSQITRISFEDLSGDIVQVEFSGAGTLSVVMDDAGTPTPAANYNQPGVDYVKGHAGLVVTGANETSHLTVFSVGRITAVNQSLFVEGVNYDGVANIAFIAIQSANGKFGSVRTGNVHYFASQGFTGVYAPGVAFSGPVNIGDITAFDRASPVLIVGSAGEARITGGNLEQENGQPVKVSGLTQLHFVAGTTSQGGTIPAQANAGVLMEDGVDVTDLIVVNP